MVRLEGRETPFEVAAGTTILDGARQAGVPFPSDCRVGACGACKCRLVEGTVHERADKAFVLSASDIARGYVLGCQSVPTSDVVVALDPPRAARPAHRLVETTGTIVRRRRLTDDPDAIAELVVRVAQPLVYTAGQFARLALDDDPDTVRSYSFARAPSLVSGGDHELVFYVRALVGGALSSRLVHGDVVGATLRIDGPHGVFHRHAAAAPMLLVAFESGLAPIRALIEDTIARGSRRTMVLLVTARTSAELCELAAIDGLVRSAEGRLRLATGGGWRESIRGFADPAGEAYLAGPAASVDAARETLVRAGLAASGVFVERFTDAPRPGFALKG